MEEQEQEPIKYRDRRSFFEESMGTVQEFTDLFSLKDHLTIMDSPYHRAVRRVKFVYDGVDKRNGWNNYRVEALYSKTDKYEFKGISNGVLNP